MTVAEAGVRYPVAHAHYHSRDLDYDFEHGESLSAFAARVLGGLAAIASRHDGGSVVAFTHGGVLDVVQRAASGRDLRTARDFPIPNTGINRLLYRHGRWQIEHWADLRHLEDESARDEVAT